MFTLVRFAFRAMVPLAAALVMAGGPAVFAAQAHCQQRAAEEMARQKAAQESGCDLDTAPTESKSSDPRSNDSGASACFVAAGAKPIDTHGSAHVLLPADSVVRDCGRHRSRHLILEADTPLVSSLHRPAYHALAPPAH